ncbi:MAG: hypothetical protein A2151_02615 [Candidatus Muproteobacteria bacterium RBG_16_65_34]|uniref:DUF3015 domain-containing protein n=1 Tax=Candidatus Muproteobacteria bacterium RBG_16_65_34 TaxID=1817760 RepID=A0A1F6TU05_9PROT|nr:MAG: hypothetical protein A2151_02615 [Candidatus Muproteobacteria bacterium RBG_16_65_34]
MNKKLVLAAVIILAPAAAMAAGENNTGSCGWGAKLFDGQNGVAPQVLAATTNGTSGNQTFGITSGTSGCTQDGVVKSNWKTAMFIDGNKEKLARDMSVGHGETLDSLASLIGVRDEHKPAFFHATKENFARIFASENVKTDDLLASLKQVLAADGALAQYSAQI